jgi:antagonist of KipI
MSFVRVIAPGLLTTVQDRGRWGLQSRGVPVAGAMDERSHRVSNALVGNRPDAATLEITLVGPELEFEEESFVAVAGASFELRVDEAQISMNQPFIVPRGGRLRFGARMRGTRAYLAFAGGVDVPPVLGSRSTHLVSGIGGLNGRALVAGDQLPIGVSKRPRRNATRSSATANAIGMEPGARVRVLPGPHLDRFPGDAIDMLQQSAYTVSPESNRMGFRLAGTPIPRVGAGEMISDVTPLGALQVPSSGLPILLMADRPTTGGYPIVATIATVDLAIAAQAAPGDSLSFAVCTPAAALAALIAEERLLMAIEAGG